MTVQSLPGVCSRIKRAPKGRPISVFIVEIEGKRKLDAVFGNTVGSSRRKRTIRPLHPSSKTGVPELAEEWVGDFDGSMDARYVRNFLKAAVEG